MLLFEHNLVYAHPFEKNAPYQQHSHSKTGFFWFGQLFNIVSTSANANDILTGTIIPFIFIDYEGYSNNYFFLSVWRNAPLRAPPSTIF